MFRVFALVTAICVLFASMAFADEKAAASFVDQTAQKAVDVLATEQADAQKLSQLETLFKTSVDMNWIARFVLGKSWRGLSEAQQAAYLKNYEAFLIKHYTANFKEYSKGTTFAIVKQRPLQREGQYLVGMDINQPNGTQPIKVDYRVREDAGTYRIIDIVVEGVSLLNSQRAEFSSVVQRKGVDHLIQQLGAKS